VDDIHFDHVDQLAELFLDLIDRSQGSADDKGHPARLGLVGG